MEEKFRRKFILTMNDLVVDGKEIDEVVIEWEEFMSDEEILNFAHEWIVKRPFLTLKMRGLSSVGESSLETEYLGPGEVKNLKQVIKEHDKRF